MFGGVGMVLPVVLLGRGGVSVVFVSGRLMRDERLSGLAVV